MRLVLKLWGTEEPLGLGEFRMSEGDLRMKFL